MCPPLLRLLTVVVVVVVHQLSALEAAGGGGQNLKRRTGEDHDDVLPNVGLGLARYRYGYFDRRARSYVRVEVEQPMVFGRTSPESHYGTPVYATYPGPSYNVADDPPTSSSVAATGYDYGSQFGPYTSAYVYPAQSSPDSSSSSSSSSQDYVSYDSPVAQSPYGAMYGIDQFPSLSSSGGGGGGGGAEQQQAAYTSSDVYDTQQEQEQEQTYSTQIQVQDPQNPEEAGGSSINGPSYRNGGGRVFFYHRPRSFTNTVIYRRR